MSQPKEPGIREFFAALAANRTPPSDALFKAISKLSGKSEKELRKIYREAEKPPNPKESSNPNGLLL